MDVLEIIAVVVTAIGVFSFSVIFTILYSSYQTATISEISAGKRDLDIIDEAIYERKPGVKKRKKCISVLRRVLFWIAIIVITPTFIFAVYSRIMGGVPMFGGKAVMVVASGSMSKKHPVNLSYLDSYNNQFNTYDLIILEKVDDDSDLKKYDVIAFVNDEGVNVIHRIVGVSNSGSGVRYTTRGDANDADDLYHPNFENVLGKYTGQKVPIVGVLLMFLQSYSGIITICALVYCLVMVDKKTEKVRLAFSKRQKLLDSAICFDEIASVDDMQSHFSEVIYYKGYAYTFNGNGFVDKMPILDENIKMKSQRSVIKQTRGEGIEEIVSQEISIPDPKGD